MTPSVRAGLSGIAAAGLALGIAELVAVATGPQSAPLVAVGGVVVDTVPGTVKDFAVAVFGVHDKTALLIGTAILLSAYAYALGVAARRSWRVGLAGIGLFAAVGVAAALTRYHAGVLAAVPTLAGAAVAVPTLRYLLARATARPAPAPAPAVPVSPASESAVPVSAASEPAVLASDVAYSVESRRLFLRALGIVAAGAAVSGVAGRLLASRRTVAVARSQLSLPVAASAAPALPAGVQAGGAVPYVTPNADFYLIDTSLYPPQIDPATWQLRIYGMVRNPITITWADLLKRPMIERYVTLACVSNEVGGSLIGNARWLGTPIKALLDEAQPLPGADQAVQRSIDGWTCGTPTAALIDGRDALLAIGMNGAPLPVRHGFPVRMVVPGLYGYVSACKWITEIQLTRFADFDAYWVPRGWAQQAPIKTESRIDTPRDGDRRSAGTIMVAGVAWAQHRGITAVEVQVDGGPWQPATLAATVSSDTWRQWSYAWPATRGRHTLRVRATDGTGAVQTSTPAAPDPDGAQGWHAIEVTVE